MYGKEEDMNESRKNNFMDRAWDMQHNIENKLSNFTSKITAKDYFLFLTMVFFICGVMLFIYVFIMGYNIILLQTMSNPLFYLVMGFICMVFFLLAKKGVIGHA